MQRYARGFRAIVTALHFRAGRAGYFGVLGRVTIFTARIAEKKLPNWLRLFDESTQRLAANPAVKSRAERSPIRMKEPFSVEFSTVKLSH